jgi:steroid delta-isomerase-like uncharacterized protein
MDSSHDVARRFYEDAYNQHNANALDQILSYTWVGHDPSAQGGAVRYDDLKDQVAELSISFPDLRVKIEDMVVDGDKVAVRITLTGTHRGPEYKGVKATGKKINLTAMGIHRVNQGKIVESWLLQDNAGLWAQLGKK